MTNLIYINKDNFRENHLLSKISFLFHEMTFYFDASKELRMMGFNIALKIFNDQNIQIYKTVLIIKKYFALVFRILILLTAVFVGFCFLGENINFLGRVVFLISVMIGFLLFAFLFSKDELDSIDNSKDTFYEFTEETFMSANMNTSTENNVKSTGKILDQKCLPLTDEKNNILGLPQDVVYKLILPLKDGSLGDGLRMKSDEFENFYRKFTTDDGEPFIIAKSIEDYKTYFYSLYYHLKGISYRYDVIFDKNRFFKEISRTIKNFEGKKASFLKVHPNRLLLKKRIIKHFESIEV
ncbi:hypothetical protein [Sphingobacterium sp. 1.A.4]|uniref:hypothetical protein n=1 Tax=Sphingobacterium sp. 1.A.4 TaxID=2044603 RepID=UPI000C0C0256|nr:hypothetical protein [Sphingobacterium sp. 1.A.4]